MPLSPADGSGEAGVKWELTGARQLRGRCYDALSAFGPSAPSLAALACEAVEAARAAEATRASLPPPSGGGGGGGGSGDGTRERLAMPAMQATHLLLLYYAKNNRLGWHRDDGKNDGASVLPVVK